MKLSQRPITKFLRFIVVNFPRASAAYVFVLLLSAVLDASTAILVAPIFDLLMNTGGTLNVGQMSKHTQFVLHFVDKMGLPQTALVIMFVFLALIIFRNMVMIIANSLEHFINLRMVYRLKIMVFEAVLNANWNFFLMKNQGEFLNVLTREISRTQSAFMHFTYCFSYTLQIILFAVIAFSVSWKLTVFCVGAGIVLMLPFLSLTRWNYRWGKQTVQSSSFANSIIQETFAMAKIIQAFSNQGMMLKHLRREQKKVVHVTLLSQVLTSAIHNIYYPLGLLTVILGYYLSLKMKLGFSELSIVMFALWKSTPILSGLMRQLGGFSEHLPSFIRVIKLHQSALEQKIVSGKIFFKGFTDLIGLHNICFNYSESEIPALDQVSIEIPKGKMIALVGRSGSGKSTLVDVVMGFHSVQEGCFTIDKVPFDSFELGSYRKKLGYVSQNSALFNTSIRNNFLWVYPDLSEEDIIQACTYAHSLSFIQALPEGLDTIVGDRGVRLSGGQVQRLALARAIVAKPELLILDEATSALDSESEEYIQKSIEQLAGNMTILVIAHRLSTIKKADYIYVLDRGKIVESGSLSELEHHNGLFQMMLEKQLH